MPQSRVWVLSSRAERLTFVIETKCMIPLKSCSFLNEEEMVAFARRATKYCTMPSSETMLLNPISLLVRIMHAFLLSFARLCPHTAIGSTEKIYRWRCKCATLARGPGSAIVSGGRFWGGVRHHPPRDDLSRVSSPSAPICVSGLPIRGALLICVNASTGLSRRWALRFGHDAAAR